MWLGGSVKLEQVADLLVQSSILKLLLLHLLLHSLYVVELSLRLLGLRLAVACGVGESIDLSDEILHLHVLDYVWVVVLLVEWLIRNLLHEVWSLVGHRHAWIVSHVGKRNLLSHHQMVVRLWQKLWLLFYFLLSNQEQVINAWGLKRILSLDLILKGLIRVWKEIFKRDWAWRLRILMVEVQRGEPLWLRLSLRSI